MEFTLMVFGIMHGLFIKGILKIGNTDGAIPWYCDNPGAIQSASKIGFRGRTKLVDARCKFTRENVQEESVDL